ncbi:response regulator [Erysipelothrix sp. Poltava]|nr:response regulator [Erysipelothrix sp. Poltava]
MYNVLLVDDEYMILSGLQKIINWDDLGLQCVGTASNGQEALEFVRKHPVDIVVTDVSMPEQSGIEFVQVCSRGRHQL